MNIPFEQNRIAGILLKNRIIRSATHEGWGDARGAPRDELTHLYEKLARGGAGLIITGECAVERRGLSSGQGGLLIDADGCIPAYRNLTARVHAAGVPIVLQLQHCGRQTTRAAAGGQPVAPSPVKDTFYGEETPQALRDDEILSIIESFASAAKRAMDAGFDGVQIHAAHGYLLSQFLSRYTNRRSDRWGGSLDNRFRIIEEILRRIRECCGNFPVLVKLNAYDTRRRGMRIEEAVEIARRLEKCGCCAVEVSCGVYEDGLNTIRGDALPVDAAFVFVKKFRTMSPVRSGLFRLFAPLLVKKYYPLENYNVDAAARIKKAVSIPVIVCGGICTLPDITKIIGQGKADAVSLCRPFIIEPDIAEKFRTGAQLRSKCIMCNYCSLALEHAPLKCYYGKIPH